MLGFLVRGNLLCLRRARHKLVVEVVIGLHMLEIVLCVIFGFLSVLCARWIRLALHLRYLMFAVVILDVLHGLLVVSLLISLLLTRLIIVYF